MSLPLQPVWLISMDSEQFYAAPTTTGTLKAWYRRYSTRAAEVDIQLVHFRDDEQLASWRDTWQKECLPQAWAALAAGLPAVIGLSFYTWNAAQFLALVRFLRKSCEGLTIIVGGPHVQEADPYLLEDPIDVVVLGGGEITFQQLLDTPQRAAWQHVAGLAFLQHGKVVRTPARERITDLDSIPSALDEIQLTDPDGKPVYDSVSYETSRGCPYKCAFCEWGTGDIGSKMNQFSLARIRSDWQKVVAAGISNIWLADSNFGALREDIEKARLICELKATTGLPRTFATSWSKKHSSKVQEIVLMLNAHGLLPHYQLALQTLTPLALELSNRKNMAANKYEPIAREMAAAGVPIAAELIWGLPGDTLAQFESNLDRLIATFPSINIFGYTLLPGTEFYARRDEYQIDTIPVAGYGKAKGEYVVGCHTFARAEGIEGYFMISAHIILNHGHIMPLTVRFLAMQEAIPATPLLRAVLAKLIAHYQPGFAAANGADKMAVYEQRSDWFLLFLADPVRTFGVIEQTLLEWLHQHQADAELIAQSRQILRLDQTYCPRRGPRQRIRLNVDFDAPRVTRQLEALQLPAPDCFDDTVRHLEVDHPGGVGDIVRGPDGGHWIRGHLVETASEPALIAMAM